MTRAHEALGSYANQFSMIETPRTTCVACVIQAGHAYWAHVGDSRLYLFRGGKLVAETRDHSKVQYLVDQGFISAQEAVTHPERNRIFSCLGGLTEPTVDLGQRTQLEEGDLIVLSTDGFWSTVKKEEIASVLADTPVLEASPVLMAEAERRGGDEGDNVSAIIVRWGPEIVPEEPSTTTTTTTETMRLGEFETQLDRTLTLNDADAAGDLTEEEIERAIDDIQATIRRYRR
jgi:serine/threonine protein phosphatase PrpC